MERVNPNLQAKIANLKPGEIGYKIAWERVKSECGQNKLKVNVTGRTGLIMALINNLQQWLKRHKVGNAPGNSRCVQLKREKH